MDMGIVNPQMVRIYSEIEPELLQRVEDVILCRRADAAERLTEYAQQVRATAQTQPQVPDAWRAGTLAERIGHAMLKGVADYIEQDALEGYEALGNADGRDRHPADARHGAGRHALRRGQDVPAAGREDRPRDEARRGGPDPLH